MVVTMGAPAPPCVAHHEATSRGGVPGINFNVVKSPAAFVHDAPGARKAMYVA